MRIVIVRHGKARPDSVDGTDSARELRGRGERQAAYIGDRLAVAEPTVARIVSSGAARAWRTAEIIGERVGVRVEGDDSLLVDEPVSVVIDRIGTWAQAVPEAGTLVLVGHNPQVSVMVGMLAGGGLGSGNLSGIGLRTGEAASLEIDPVSLSSGMIGGTLHGLDRLEEEG